MEEKMDFKDNGKLKLLIIVVSFPGLFVIEILLKLKII